MSIAGDVFLGHRIPWNRVSNFHSCSEEQFDDLDERLSLGIRELGNSLLQVDGRVVNVLVLLMLPLTDEVAPSLIAPVSVWGVIPQQVEVLVPGRPEIRRRLAPLLRERFEQEGFAAVVSPHKNCVLALSDLREHLLCMIGKAGAGSLVVLVHKCH